MKVVIDGDSIPYSVGFAAKGEPLAYVLATVKHALDNIMEESGCTERELYIKGSGNFRDDVAWSKVYKGTRVSAKPPFFEEMIEYMKTHQGAIEVDGMEADDKVSILLWEDFVAWHGDRDRCQLVLSSADKDLKNTPGWHHNPRTKELYWVSTMQASRHFSYQMLAGDRVDNIPGLPVITGEIATKYGVTGGKCGEARAKKLMQTCKDGGTSLVYDCYISYGESQGWSESQTREYITEQGKLLWMTRKLDAVGQPIQYEINEDTYEETKADRGGYKGPTEGGGAGGVTEGHEGEAEGLPREQPSDPYVDFG